MAIRGHFFSGRIFWVYTETCMDRRKKISWGVGILFMVIGSLFGWVVWMNTDRSETLVWESLKGENLLVKDDTRIETQEEMGVPEKNISEKPDSSHLEKEAALMRSPETVATSPAKEEMTKGTDSRSDVGSRPFWLQRKPVSFGFEKAQRKSQDIDTIVLHSSFNNQGGDRYSVDKVIGIWKSYGVAPHFLIDRKGNVYQLVDEENVAYHAGVSEMKDGRKNVNDFSFGVEILNAEDDGYTDAQYGAIRDLVAYLKGTYPIKYVVGHDDIAPGRKTDPWNFDWKRL